MAGFLWVFSICLGKYIIWSGLCKTDSKGKAIKVVGYSCIVVKDLGPLGILSSFIGIWADSCFGINGIQFGYLLKFMGGWLRNFWADSVFLDFFGYFSLFELIWLNWLFWVDEYFWLINCTDLLSVFLLMRIFLLILDLNLSCPFITIEPKFWLLSYCCMYLYVVHLCLLIHKDSLLLNNSYVGLCKLCFITTIPFINFLFSSMKY